MIFPNPFRAVAALFRVVIALFKREPVLVSQDVLDQRLTECFKCKKYVPSSGQCLVCTCFVEVKAQLDTEKCPIGKW